MKQEAYRIGNTVVCRTQGPDTDDVFAEVGTFTYASDDIAEAVCNAVNARIVSLPWGGRSQ